MSVSTGNIVAELALNNQSSAVTSTLLALAPGSGMYQLNWYAAVRSGTTGQVQPSVTFTDDTQTQTIQAQATNSGNPGTNAKATCGTITFKAVAATDINIAVPITAGTPTFDAYFSLVAL